VSEIKSRRSPDGNAYGRGPQSHDAEITEVGPGTPGGEFMRRYWHPVSLSEKVTDTPQKLRILGEDLVIFRDRAGKVGVLHARCAHRGTTLYYGKVEARGIRCCYHGWLFSVEGKCLEQPCEPNLGAEHRDNVRQAWYPVEERYGLVWTYMGPPEKKPVLPRFDMLENLGPDEKYLVEDDATSAGGDHTTRIVPTNWLNDWENVMDPFHVPILHAAFSGVQFVPEVAVMPVVEWGYEQNGMKYTAYRKLDDGREVDRVTIVLLPYARIVPDATTGLTPGTSKHIGWVVPVDDTHHRLFHVRRAVKSYEKPPLRPYRGRTWSQLSEEERQKFPGDWEAQVGQGPISLHSEEHLASSDKGVVMLRRLLRREIRKVQEGGDPIGVAFNEADAEIKVGAGNFFR
jgi:phenylpropionate dioxygenase-like ring-hydroxylating dioxygenase large terminal subunit